MRGRTASAWVGLFIVGIASGTPGCIPSTANELPAVEVSPRLAAEFVVASANHPSALAPAADGRVFYTEKNSGQIRIIERGLVLPEPFATAPVNFAGDRGLLGIALHPRFAENNRVYVFYTRSDTGVSTNDPQAVIDHRVVYFEADGNLAVGGEVFVASIPASGNTRRVSGRILFDAAGRLLVAVGDQEEGTTAQDASSRNGKILRFNDDGSIPTDNPIAGSPTLAQGLRIVRGIALDPLSGEIYGADQNETGLHEVNHIRVNRNYGWPEVAGVAKTPAQLTFAESTPGYTDPIFETSAGVQDIAGADFNPSTRYGAAWLNQFFSSQPATRQIIALRLGEDRQVVGTEVFASSLPGVITDLRFTPAGTLYVACENAIVRIVPQ